MDAGTDRGGRRHRRTDVVALKTPIPVYISYVTAFLGPDGLMHYRRDVYGRNKNLLDALARRGQGAWEK